MLFWAIFCPLDWFSVDKRRHRASSAAAIRSATTAAVASTSHGHDDDDDGRVEKDDKTHTAGHLRQGLGIFALVTQIFLVYFANGVFKGGKDWRTEFTATYFALR